MSLYSALAARRIFITYRKADKSPVDPATGYNSNGQDSSTWMLPGIALGWLAALGEGFGVGIVIHEGSGLFCVDIDGCIGPDGALSDIGRTLVSDFSGVYAERSQSGRGMHLIGSYVGASPDHGTKNIPLHIELYTSARFIGLTEGEGDVLKDATLQLWSAVQTYFQRKAPKAADTNWTTEYDPLCTFTGSVEDRIAVLLRTKSFAAKFNSGKVTFEDLHAVNVDKLAGQWPGNEGDLYDASSADQSYFNHLAFGLGNNCEEMERYALGGTCPLHREKWNTRPDYLRTTILKACAIPKRWKAARAAPPPPAAAPPSPGTLVAPPPPSSLPEAVPEALYSCTDQANAERLQQLYRDSLIAVAGDFHTWDGRRWKLDDGLAQRFACDLSRIVILERNEASDQFNNLQARAVGGEALGDELLKLEEKVKALGAWGAKCEMRSTQEAALSMLRKLLNVPVDKIDANPWLLNVDNGTIDLRTGVLSPHNSGQLITKLAPVTYDPTAQAPRFRQFLSEIVQHDSDVVSFMQRWYGYSATGDAREQKLLIKHGPGGNGKSTLGEALDSVLGEYSSPATLGLLTGKAGASDTAHLAEIADLRGRRLVTASESEDGAKLKEALLKQLTGGDTLKGKRLYGQLFAFRPTHKLELLTNHKPVIKGSDFSIWRRIMLLSFPVKFGSALEVERGEAMAVRDPALGDVLRTERSGILAWVVEGTRLWLSQGLNPPKAVLDASAEYRQQQDHIAEFLAECCTLDPEAKQAMPLLYSTYKAWCYGAGRDHPVTRQRLIDELERRVPRFVRPDMSRRTAQGTYVTGLSVTAA